jgi:dephospho-CoA kinase
MLRVALTGGIATGKSYVVRWFRRHGVDCIDADELAHNVTAAGTEASHAIAARFGMHVLDPSGAIDRGKLADIVFHDRTARHDLEAIVHPAVYRAIHAGFRAFELLGAKLAVADIPLLYETHKEGEFDKVIATVCPRSVQMTRLLERGLSEEDAALRLDAQMPANEKGQRADFVVTTDGTFEQTDAQLVRVLELLAASEPNA